VGIARVEVSGTGSRDMLQAVAEQALSFLACRLFHILWVAVLKP
jgi:hypothetical protein